MPSGVGVWRLQPIRLRVWSCRPSRLHPQNQWAGHGNAWTPSSGGTDKSFHSTALPARAAITFTTTASQRDAPVGMHQDHGDRQRLPEGARWLQACCSSVAAAPRLSWNLRVTPDDQALIDRAVRTSGLTRTDFVLQAARNAARELLVQQVWQAISPEQFDQFLRQLDAPPTPSDRLQRTMTAPRPWQR